MVKNENSFLDSLKRISQYKTSMLQIIGTNKCKETQKAVRYFKEHRYPFQFVDLKERELSAKEWESIFNSNEAKDCIDTESAYYKKEGYSWREYDAKEELKAHIELLKTPILREKNRAIVGFDTSKLKEWGY